MVVVPTTTAFGEGFNQVVVESVLAGRPVVTSVVCPARNYVSEAVVEVPPDEPGGYAQAILSLYQNAAVYEQKRAAGAQYEGQFYDKSNGWGAALQSAIQQKDPVVTEQSGQDIYLQMGIIVLIPSLLAIWCLINKSHREAFLYVYVSTVMLLPHWGRWNLPGLPDPTFNEAAILPIAGAYLIKGRKTWKVSFMDFLVFGLLFVMALSQLVNSGYADAQNLIFDMMASGVLPYVLAKGIIEPNGLSNKFARHFVLCLIILFPATLYELKFSVNPFRLLLDPFFPGQAAGWVTTFRYGFPRVSAAYSHPILAGVVFMTGIQLQLWLLKSKSTGYGTRVSPRRVDKPFLVTCILFVELLITFCRGPQIGFLIGRILGWPGRGKNPRSRMRLLLLAAALIGIPVGLWLNSYVSVGRGGATTESQETAAYRKELVDKYMDIAKEKMWLGWGIDHWPKIPGMPSIDNYYLLLALRHGMIATGLLGAILVLLMARLYRNAMKNSPFLAPGASLSFTLLVLLRYKQTIFG